MSPNAAVNPKASRTPRLLCSSCATISDAKDNTLMDLRGQYAERGYAMAALLVMLGVMSVMMTAMLPAWRFQAKREKELELVFRGEQYIRAIALYERRMGPGSRPPTLDALVQQRFIRKKYKDPMTEDGEFQVLYIGANNACSWRPSWTAWTLEEDNRAWRNRRCRCSQLSEAVPRRPARNGRHPRRGEQEQGVVYSSVPRQHAVRPVAVRVCRRRRIDRECRRGRAAGRRESAGAACLSRGCRAAAAASVAEAHRVCPAGVCFRADAAGRAQSFAEPDGNWFDGTAF